MMEIYDKNEEEVKLQESLDVLLSEHDLGIQIQSESKLKRSPDF